RSSHHWPDPSDGERLKRKSRPGRIRPGRPSSIRSGVVGVHQVALDLPDRAVGGALRLVGPVGVVFALGGAGGVGGCVHVCLSHVCSSRGLGPVTTPQPGSTIASRMVPTVTGKAEPGGSTVEEATMPQQAWSKKRERQYEHIKEG